MSISSYGVLDRQTTNTERWVTFAALFLFGFTASCNLFKASPVMMVIGGDLGLDAGGLGLIMTFYSIAALVMAFPGALVMRKIGVKAMVVISCAIMVCGTAISAFSSDSGMFLAGRAVEGIAYGLICVCGPNILPRLFPRKQMGSLSVSGLSGFRAAPSLHSSPRRSCSRRLETGRAFGSSRLRSASLL